MMKGGSKLTPFVRNNIDASVLSDSLVGSRASEDFIKCMVRWSRIGKIGFMQKGARCFWYSS